MEDDSCRRAGAIPFKWEICPGTPKHARSASAASAKVAPNKLTPPPSMASPYHNHSPCVSSAGRSASLSPSRRRQGGGQRRRPTAFIEVAPRKTVAAAAAPEAETTVAFRCFPIPMLRRRSSKKGGSGSGSSSSSSSGSFRSAHRELGLRRSASSSFSSLPLPPGRRFAEAKEEVGAATGWFF